jgi:lipopolysaccharide heptosyltransferase I
MSVALDKLDPQRVLIIKPSAIGDVVHTLPILRLVRNKWPAAKVSWLVTPACSGLLEGHPLLDEVILFDRKRFAGLWRSPRVFTEWRGFTRSLRERRFDLVLDLQGLFRSAWLARKTAAPVRVGFANAREMAWMFYTHRVPIETMEQHAIDRYLKLARHIGCDDGTGVDFPFATTDADRRHVRGLLTAAGVAGPYAVLLPGTNWATKRWPIEKFAALIGPLRERFGLASVLAGGADAAAMARDMPGAIDLAGQTTLKQLTALLEDAALVVANDSGPMHIASALGRPLVAPFGPTNPIRTGPYQRLESVIRLNIACSPCYSRTCWHQSCLRWLDSDAVIDLARRQMNAGPNPADPRPEARAHSAEAGP